jgi:hypothetical protein
MTSRQFWCGFRYGHEWGTPRCTADGRWETACWKCDYVSSGADMSDVPRPVQKYSGVPERHRLFRWRDYLAGR